MSLGNGSRPTAGLSGYPTARPPYHVAARSLLEHTLLDTAAELLGQRPWAQITMAQVATGAGVSRQTLYNTFGSRDQFALAFVIREGERHLGTVESAIAARSDDPRAALRDALEAFLTAAGGDPLIGMLVSDDGGGGMLPLLTTRSGPVIEWASDRLATTMQRHWPSVADADAKLLAEAVVRLAISYVTVPSGTPHKAATDAGRLLEPFIQRAAVGSDCQ